MGAVENRDPRFWREVINHPDVLPWVARGQVLNIEALLQHPGVTPLASDHGGYWFIQTDALGCVFELHTMFTPQGWGREALETAREAFRQMFASGANLIVTTETADNARSRPPLSFGFREAGPYRNSPLGDQRTWFLTRDAWEQSPARRRVKCH